MRLAGHCVHWHGMPLSHHTDARAQLFTLSERQQHCQVGEESRGHGGVRLKAVVIVVWRQCRRVTMVRVGWGSMITADRLLCFVPEWVTADRLLCFVPEWVTADWLLCFVPEWVTVDRLLCFVPEWVTADRLLCFVPEWVTADRLLCFVPEWVTADWLLCFVPEWVTADRLLCFVPEWVTADRLLCFVPQSAEVEGALPQEEFAVCFQKPRALWLLSTTVTRPPPIQCLVSWSNSHWSSHMPGESWSNSHRSSHLHEFRLIIEKKKFLQKCQLKFQKTNCGEKLVSKFKEKKLTTKIMKKKLTEFCTEKLRTKFMIINFLEFSAKPHVWWVSWSNSHRSRKWWNQCYVMTVYVCSWCTTAMVQQCSCWWQINFTNIAKALPNIPLLQTLNIYLYTIFLPLHNE